MNLCKLKSLYMDGMKPYIFDTTDSSRGWYQDPDMKLDSINISIFAKLLSYGIKDIQNFTFNELNRVKFEVQFKPNQKLYIAYSEVYTYSMLLNDLEYLVENRNKQEEELERQKKQIEKEEDINIKMKGLKRL